MIYSTTGNIYTRFWALMPRTAVPEMTYSKSSGTLTHIRQLAYSCNVFACYLQFIATQKHVKHTKIDFNLVFIKYEFMHHVCFSYTCPISSTLPQYWEWIPKTTKTFIEVMQTVNKRLNAVYPLTHFVLIFVLAYEIEQNISDSAVTICQILFPIDKRYDKSKLSR